MKYIVVVDLEVLKNLKLKPWTILNSSNCTTVIVIEDDYLVNSWTFGDNISSTYIWNSVNWHPILFRWQKAMGLKLHSKFWPSDAANCLTSRFGEILKTATSRCPFARRLTRWWFTPKEENTWRSLSSGFCWTNYFYINNKVNRGQSRMHILNPTGNRTFNCKRKKN